MNSLEGRLAITLEMDPDRLRVRITSSRPVHAGRLFEGRTPEEVLRLMPLLFHVCGHAHRLAATLALQAAGADPAPAGPVEAAYRTTALETLREQLLHWLPLVEQHAGRPPPEGWFQALQRAINGTTVPGGDWFHAIEEVLFDGQADLFADLPGAPALVAWSESDPSGAAQVLRRLARESVPILPRGVAPVSLVGLETHAALVQIGMSMLGPNGGEFGVRPRWRGAPGETGSLARLWKHRALAELRRLHPQAGRFAREAARLLEIAQALRAKLRTNPPEMRSSGVRSASPASGIGIGACETARGLLIHGVEVENGRIRRYRILAPTEWNFSPGGPAQRMLEALEPDPTETLERRAGEIVQTVDPCVAFSVVTESASGTTRRRRSEHAHA